MSSIRERTVLCVIDLPKKLTSRRNLRAHLSKYGEISNVSVNKDNRSAVVTFTTHFGAQAAKTHGQQYEDRTMKMYWAEGTSVDPRAKEDYRRKPNEPVEDSDTLWEDDEKETFGIEPVKVKKTEESKKSAENLVVKPTGIKKRLGPTLKIGEGSSKIKLPQSQKSPTKPGKVNPKMLSSIKKSLLSQGTRQKLMRRVGDSNRSVISKQKTSLSVEDQTPKASVPMAERTDLKMKLSLLDERDRSIRTKTKLDSNIKTAVATKGTCPDMCPERERIMRQYALSVAAYEMVPGTYDMDENKAVKEYTRSSADQEVPLPHDLRPEPVLSMTMNYLITNIINKVDSPDVNKAVWYSFCWNRLRSVRKDIILQQLCDMETVKIVEQCARFHICCYDHMWGAEVSGFDDKINTQILIDCLQTLRHMYEDLAKHGISCPNESEFYSYLILLKLKSGDVMWEYQQYSLEIQLSSEVQFAIQAYMAFKNNMYSKFFSLVKKGSYLTSCLLQRYFDEVRTQALKTMLKAYCLPGKTVGLSSTFIVYSLKFDSQANALKFCDRVDIELKVDSEKNEDDVYVTVSSFLVREKRLPIANAVVGENTPLPVYIPRNVHSSFDEFGRLKISLHDDDNEEEEEEQPEIVSSEDISDCKEDSYCSEESLYFEQFESKASVVNVPEVPVQKPVFKFSLSPSITSRVSENVFNKNIFLSGAGQDNTTTSNVNIELSPFYNNSLTSSSPFSSPSHAQPMSSPEAFEMEQDLDKDTFCANNQAEMSIVQNQPTHYQNSAVTHSQQPFFSSLAFPDKVDTSYQDKREESKSPSLNRDLKSVFSFTSTINKTNEHHSDSQHSFYGNKIESDSFNSSPLRKDLSYGADTFDSSSNLAGTSIVIEPQDDLKEDRKDLSVTDKDKEAVRTALLNKLLKEKLEEEKLEEERLRMEEMKREAEEKQRMEIEEKKVMQQLRKDVRKRMKAINVRNCARRWKEKINKLKQTRADFPSLFQLSVKDHLSHWGTVNYVPVSSIFQRAKDKRNLTGVASQLLRSGITDSCRYIGSDLAETLAQSAVKVMRKSDVKPIFWKLAVSVPWITTTSMELTVFNRLMKTWCKQSFYKDPDLQLGSVESSLTSVGIPVNISIHFSENLQSSQNIQGMDALVFVVLNEAESEKTCLQRLRSLLLCQMSRGDISVAVMNIGGVKFERVLKIELEELHEQNVISHWSISSWSGPTSIYNSLTFLAENLTVSPHICASSLEALVKEVSEDLFDALSSGQHFSLGLAEAVKNPNNVIHLYNTCLSKLEVLLTNGKLEKYFNLAEEFKVCVPPTESGGPELLCGKQYGDVYKSEVTKKINCLKLKKFPKWPPASTSHLVKTLKSYCSEVHDVNIFPQIIRMLDIPDDVNLVEYLQRTSWLNIIEVLTECNIRYHLLGSDKSKRFYVIFNKVDTQRLIQNQWWLKLPLIVQSELC